MIDRRDVPLDAVAALGGRAIDPASAAAAIEARLLATDGLAAMRAVPLALIDAVEPLHHAARLMAFAHRTHQPRP